MIELPHLAGKTVAVMGLGRSGRAAAEALAKSGAEVWAWDDLADARRRAMASGIPLRNLADCELSRAAALVLSPGIPLHHPAPHPVVNRARAAGCQILGDIELLACAQGEARYVGVTGTNGKSTTTALIGHILGSAGMRAEVGGNLGTPALALAPLDASGTYVLEVSSYQLELTFSITFDVAVLLNVQADHLDRHGGLEGYVAAKRRIFMHQGREHTAVVGADDPQARAVYEELARAGRQRVVPVSGAGPVAGGVYACDDGWLVDDTEGGAERRADLNAAPALLGAHNWQNASAAYAAARSFGLSPTVITAAIQSFLGLPHRQERLASVAGVRFVNDSKATNADAAGRALACHRNVYWIAGGQAKEGGIESLAPHFARVAHAFLIGEAAPAFARTLEGRVPCTIAGDLESATRAAFRTARAAEGAAPVVLLSPACASFDQFRDFEARGDAFRAVVARLAEEDADGESNAGAAP